MLVLGLGALVAATLAAEGVPGRYAMIMPASMSRLQALDLIAEADGGFAGFGGFGRIILAVSDDPGFASRLRGRGVPLVLPLPRVSGCNPPTNRDEQ